MNLRPFSFSIMFYRQWGVFCMCKSLSHLSLDLFLGILYLLMLFWMCYDDLKNNSYSNSVLILYKFQLDFCILTLYLATLLSNFKTLITPLYIFFGFSIYKKILFANVDNFSYLFSGVTFLKIALAGVCSIIWPKVYLYLLPLFKSFKGKASIFSIKNEICYFSLVTFLIKKTFPSSSIFLSFCQ